MKKYEISVGPQYENLVDVKLSNSGHWCKHEDVAKLEKEHSDHITEVSKMVEENLHLKDLLTSIYDRLDGSWYTPDLQSDIREDYLKLVRPFELDGKTCTHINCNTGITNRHEKCDYHRGW